MNAEFEKAIGKAVRGIGVRTLGELSDWLLKEIEADLRRHFSPFSPSEPGEAAKKTAYVISHIFYPIQASYDLGDYETRAAQWVQKAIDSEVAGLRALLFAVLKEFDESRLVTSSKGTTRPTLIAEIRASLETSK